MTKERRRGRKFWYQLASGAGAAGGNCRFDASHDRWAVILIHFRALNPVLKASGLMCPCCSSNLWIAQSAKDDVVMCSSAAAVAHLRLVWRNQRPRLAQTPGGALAPGVVFHRQLFLNYQIATLRRRKIPRQSCRCARSRVIAPPRRVKPDPRVGRNG